MPTISVRTTRLTTASGFRSRRFQTASAGWGRARASPCRLLPLLFQQNAHKNLTPRPRKNPTPQPPSLLRKGELGRRKILPFPSREGWQLVAGFPGMLHPAPSVALTRGSKNAYSRSVSKIDADENHGQQQRGSLNDRVIALAQGIDGGRADAGNGERSFPRQTIPTVDSRTRRRSVVKTGRKAFLRACLNSTVIGDSPLARAVRM